MKKFVSVVLALMMVFSMFATVSAATMKETLVDTYGISNPYVLAEDLLISISAQRNGEGYSSAPLSIIDSNISNGIGIDYKTTLDMSLIKALFNRDLISIAIPQADASDEFYRGKVETSVTVTITYPATADVDESALLLPTTGTLDNATFTESEARAITTDGDKKIATIKYKNTDGLTVDNLDDNNYAALNDITFTLENAIKYNTTGDHIVTVTMEGETTITYGEDTPDNTDDNIAQVIKYKGATATYTVSINAPSSGGGSSSLAIKFETNGGNEIKNISVRRGNKAQLPTPVREGYVFTGWYTDSALTTPFDENTLINRNYTLYAAWVEDNGSAGNGHATPGSLNGEDHFAYVVGYPDGTVRPNDNITRAEVTSIFFRLLKESVRNESLTSSNNFADVNDDDWYNTAVSTMANLGIVNGRTADEFVPNAFITRAEFAAICARFDDSAFEMVDDFADVAGHWAEAEIHEAAAHGWIRGYEDNTFRPDRFITRAEAMTMINRVLNRVPETAEDLLTDMTVWPDNSDESVWYYLPVQEATNSHDYDMKNRIYEKWTAFDEAFDWTKYE